MTVVVHSALGDLPLKVHLDRPSTQELRAKVAAHFSVEADTLKLVCTASQSCIFLLASLPFMSDWDACVVPGSQGCWM